MGYIQHDAVIAVVSGYDEETIKRIEEFRASMDDSLSRLDVSLHGTFSQFLVGPVVGINGYHMYCFLPDGSKEGWAPSDKAQKLREQFQEIAQGERYDDGSGSGDVVAVRFGGDFGSDVGTCIAFTNDRRWVYDKPQTFTGPGHYQAWDVESQSWKDDVALTEAAQ